MESQCTCKGTEVNGTLEERKDLTMDALCNPQVGDVFTEMYSFWIHVLKVSEGYVWALEGHGGQTMPRDGHLMKLTRAQFIAKYSYGSIPGAWVYLVKRQVDFSGWLEAKGEAA